VIDGLPPVQSATGIALDPMETIAWATEEIIDGRQLIRVGLSDMTYLPIVVRSYRGG
jgi:hypothetical protein